MQSLNPLLMSNPLVPSCPAATIATLQSFDFLYHGTSDASWLALVPTMWYQTSLSLSIMTACFPSMKSFFDSFSGNTLAAGIDAPYQLNRIKGKNCFQATAYVDEPKASNSLSTPSHAPRLTANSPTEVSCYTGAKGPREGLSDGKVDGQSESVQNLTEGVTVINKVNIQYAAPGRSDSLESSESSIYGGRHVEVTRKNHV